MCKRRLASRSHHMHMQAAKYCAALHAGPCWQVAETLMQLAYEKACSAFETKQAAKRAKQGSVVPGIGTPTRQDQVGWLLAEWGWEAAAEI